MAMAGHIGKQGPATALRLAAGYREYEATIATEDRQ
jgi:hypothetical protein